MTKFLRKLSKKFSRKKDVHWLTKASNSSKKKVLEEVVEKSTRDQKNVIEKYRKEKQHSTL